MIDPGTLAIFALASAALIAVPGPAVLLRRHAEHSPRATRWSRVGARDRGGRARACRSGGGGALRTACVLRRRVLGGQVRGRRVSDRSRALDTHRRSRRCGRRAEQRCSSSARLRAGCPHQRVQPEGRPLLPRVPAAVRRSRCGSAGSSDRALRARVRRDRLRSRPRLGAGRRRGRGSIASLPELSAGAALRIYMVMGVATALAGGDRAGHAQSLRQP